MQHHFNTEIAKKYDITTAVMLDCFYYWIEKNRANEKHFYDGRYWTYNTKKALTEWFPYLTERQIDYAIKKMVDEGLLCKGNYNENKHDRTLWYAITDFGYSILQNCEMYYNNTITNTNTIIKEKIYKKESVVSIPSDTFSSDDFDHWFNNTYLLYPRKVNKVKSREAYEHKLRGLTRECAKNKANDIYLLLKRQVALWSKENDFEGRKLEHIPYFSSWLNANIEDSPHLKRRK